MKFKISDLLQQFADNAMGRALYHRHQKALDIKRQLKSYLSEKDWNELHDAWIHLDGISNSDREGFCKTISDLKKY